MRRDGQAAVGRGRFPGAERRNRLDEPAEGRSWRLADDAGRCRRHIPSKCDRPVSAPRSRSDVDVRQPRRRPASRGVDPRRRQMDAVANGSLRGAGHRGVARAPVPPPPRGGGAGSGEGAPERASRAQRCRRRRTDATSSGSAGRSPRAGTCEFGAGARRPHVRQNPIRPEPAMRSRTRRTAAGSVGSPSGPPSCVKRLSPSRGRFRNPAVNERRSPFRQAETYRLLPFPLPRAQLSAFRPDPARANSSSAFGDTRRSE